MVDYLSEIGAAADRIAARRPDRDVEPNSERDALGHSFAAMTDEPARARRRRRRPRHLGARSRTWRRPPRRPAARSARSPRRLRVAQGAERQVRMVDVHPRGRPRGRPRRAAECRDRPLDRAGGRRGPSRGRQRRRGRRAGDRGDARRCRVLEQVAGAIERARPAPADRRDRRHDHRRSPSRRTCWRSTRPSRPPAPVSRARASRSSPRRSASWPRSRSPRRARSPG